MKLKLEEFPKLDQPVAEQPAKQMNAFEIVLGCLNPFSQYVLKEMMAKQDTLEKVWELDESIFQKPRGEVRRENLLRTSAEMFAIYKFTNDPHMLVKSKKYTEGFFVACKDLLPKQEETLFETSILKDIKKHEDAIIKH